MTETRWGSYLRGHARELVRTPWFHRHPLRTIARMGSWALHCALGIPGRVPLPTWGCRLHLPPRLRQAGSTALYLAREDYEPELRCLDRLIPSGGVFIDGGANIGIYTVVAARLVGETGQVVAFEPGRVSYEGLVRNVALNGLRNVIALNAALGAKDGEARLYHVGEAPNSYSLGGERLDDERSNFEVVRVMTLDRAITDRGVSRVDVLKLDVEGAEELVLDGATEVLRRFRPVVLFEVGDEGAGRLGLTREGAWNVLKAQDYLLAVADPEGRLTEVEAPRDGNNVALPSERGGGTIRRR